MKNIPDNTFRASVYVTYLPPVRFVRVASNIQCPKMIVPLDRLQGVDLEELENLSNTLSDKLKDVRIGLNLDFSPVVIQPSDSLDTVRDFINPAAALNFYNQLINNNDPRAFDVSFLADGQSQSKRLLKYSKFTIPAKHLHERAKRYYKVVGVTCMKLIDLEEYHINEAGLTYAPHNLVKGKLNSRFADSLESIYRDRKYKAKAEGVVAVLTVTPVTLTEADHENLQYVLGEKSSGLYHISKLVDLLINPEQASSV